MKRRGKYKINKLAEPPPPDGSSRCIVLTQGKVAVVDAVDYDWLQRWNVGPRKDNTSGHKGIYWDKNTNMWLTYFTVNRNQIWVGRFKNKNEAIDAYRMAVIKHHGQFARFERFNIQCNETCRPKVQDEVISKAHSGAEG